MREGLRHRTRRMWRGLVARGKRLLGAVWAWIVHVYRRLSGELRRGAVIAEMEPGDIILASPRTLKLSPGALIYRLLLKAHYVHSMLYLGAGKILHTTTRHGVVVGPVPRSIFKKDRYTILRAPHLRPDQRQQVVREALAMSDMKLDRAGLLTNVPARLLGLRKPLVRFEKNRLWCSKLIHRAYSATGIELVPPEERENVTSEDLSHSPLLRVV